MDLLSVFDDEKQICVSKKLYEHKGSENNLIERIIKCVKKGLIEFPYKHKWISLTTIQQNITKFPLIDYKTSDHEFKLSGFVSKTNLIQTKYQSDEKKSTNLTIITTGAWYQTYHTISDWFVETVRLKARRIYKHLPPIEEWKQEHVCRRILHECWKRYQKFDRESFREAMYPSIKECETFKASLAYLIYTKLFPNNKFKSILDICSGWGDRLIAAIASGIPYTGIDANSALFPCYAQMIDKLYTNNLFIDSKEKKQQYKMIQGDFMDVKLPPSQTYDLIFSCPPYFDLELYDENSKTNENQSVVKYKGLENWVKNFLCASLKKSWSYLENNGYMVIVINDFNDLYDAKQKPVYCEAMILYAQAFLEDCVFQGVVAYCSFEPKSYHDNGVKLKDKPHQPIWIFKKTKKVCEYLITPKTALESIQKFYPYLI